MSSSEDSCSDCNTEFNNKYDRYGHNCTPDEQYRPHAQKRDDFLNDIEIPEGERYLYILLLERNSDNKEFFYVGQTIDFRNRIHGHFRDSTIKMISADGSGFTTNYSIKELVDIEAIDVESKREAVYMERQRANKLILEKETTAVLGGR